MNIELDSYPVRARVAPIFVLVVMILLGVIPWYPGVLTIELGAAAVIVSVGLPVLLSQLGGVMGKRKEALLWESWGGPPTTVLLRHRTTDTNPVLRGRWHSRLAELFPDIKIPTESEERSDPKAADDVYEACTKRLLALTRNRKQFALLHSENTSYGFRRNLWGMKSIGVALASAALIGCIIKIIWLIASKANVPGPVLGCTVTCSALLYGGLFVVNRAWVKEKADAFAERLLESLELIDGPRDQQT